MGKVFIRPMSNFKAIIDKLVALGVSAAAKWVNEGRCNSIFCPEKDTLKQI